MGGLVWGKHISQRTNSAALIESFLQTFHVSKDVPCSSYLELIATYFIVLILLKTFGLL